MTLHHLIVDEWHTVVVTRHLQDLVLQVDGLAIEGTTPGVFVLLDVRPLVYLGIPYRICPLWSSVYTVESTAESCY